MPARLIAILLLVSTSALAASDYAREKRWADQITPTIVVGDPIYLTQKNAHKFLGIYTKASHARMGVVVVHGRGINPNWGMIGTLRRRLPDYGYATLSIQMPVLAADAVSKAYVATFPEAVERLQLAVGYLEDQGYKRIAIVSHSMGSRMTYAYMKHNPAHVDAWVAMGMSETPAHLYRGIKVPVLDLYGSMDLPQVRAGAAARRQSLAGHPGSKQEVIAGADHFYAGHEDAMVKAVKDFLDRMK